MYSQSRCGCGCDCGGCNFGNNDCRLAPIMAPRKVCVTRSCRYVEQPVICPIECRHVQSVVPVPRYYPRYEQTFVTQDMGNNMAGNGYGAGMPGASGMNTGYGNNTGNSYGNNAGNNSCGCSNNRCGL